MERVYFAARYDKGTADYINCPMNREEYDRFYDALVTAEPAESAQSWPVRHASAAELNMLSPPMKPRTHGFFTAARSAVASASGARTRTRIARQCSSFASITAAHLCH